LIDGIRVQDKKTADKISGTGLFGESAPENHAERECPFRSPAARSGFFRKGAEPSRKTAEPRGEGGPRFPPHRNLAAEDGRMWGIPGNASIIRPLSGLKRGGKKFFEKKFPVVFQKVIV
jgi:hypothetical protein